MPSPEICNAEHPDHPGVFCDVRTDQHKAFHSNREHGLAWPDLSYPTPVPRTSGGRRRSTKSVLAEFLRTPGGPSNHSDKVRRTDPDTSRTAAAGLGDLRPSQEEVLGFFRTHGEMTDETLVAYAAEQGSTQTPSGLRTRRRELVDAGLLVNTGRKALTATTREAYLWAVAEDHAES